MLQLEEASEIYGRHNRTEGQARCLQGIAELLAMDNQHYAAEEVASRALNLSDKPGPSQVYDHHHTLGHLCGSRGEMEASIRHFNSALGIASSLGLEDKKAQICWCLAKVFANNVRFCDAEVYLERSRPYMENHPFTPYMVTALRAYVWSGQGRFEEAKSELLRIIGAYEGGAPREGLKEASDILDDSKALLKVIEVGMGR